MALVDDLDYMYLKNYNWVYAFHPSKELYGYAIGTTGKYRQKRMHRIILGAKPGQIVDHINFNGVDNRRKNIRFVTASESAFNRRFYNRYGHKGIGKTKDRKGNHKYWIARITIKGDRKYLGTFKTKKEAIAVYKAASLKYYGI